MPTARTIPILTEMSNQREEIRVGRTTLPKPEINRRDAAESPAAAA
jgi:hypothetical protein